MASYGADCQSLLPAWIPGYRILESLGRGGQSVVVLATEIATERKVALKLVPRNGSGAASGGQPWRNEVLVAARMEHPNLVRLYGVQETRQWYGMVFEYVAGGTLQRRLNEPMSPKDAALLVLKIARGVHKIHEMGFLHLDLKPSNVLIDVSAGGHPRWWVPKISDFGIARPNARCVSDPSEGTGTVVVGVGTVPYMAPEQVLGVTSLLSVQTDVYGLGGVLAALLRGGVRWDAATRTNAKAGLIAIGETCMQADPHRRYASAKCVADALQEWLSQQNHSKAFVHAEARRRSHWRRAGWTMAVGVAAMGIYALAPAWKPPAASHFVPQESDEIGYDMAKWVNDLDTAPAAITSEIASRLQSTSVLWTKRLMTIHTETHFADSVRLEAYKHSAAGKHKTGEFDLIYRCALLQRNAAERIAASTNTERFSLSRTLLMNAKALLDRADALVPSREDVVKDWIHTMYVLGCMRGASAQFDTPGHQALMEERLDALVAAGKQVERLQSTIQRVYWAGCILDELRRIHRYARWSSHMEIVIKAEKAVAECRTSFEVLSALPEIACRFTWMESCVQIRSMQPTNGEADWFIPDDRDPLVREAIVQLLCDAIFQDKHDLKESVEAEDWDAFVRDAMEWVADQGLDEDLLPKVFQQDVIRPVAAIGTQCRSAGQLNRAEQIQQRHLAICNALSRNYPDHPDLYLAECESHLQAYKNALRHEADALAIASLMRSQEMALKALAISPNNTLAQHQVADRVKRLAKLQSELGTSEHSPRSNRSGL